MRWLQVFRVHDKTCHCIEFSVPVCNVPSLSITFVKQKSIRPTLCSKISAVSLICYTASVFISAKLDSHQSGTVCARRL